MDESNTLTNDIGKIIEILLRQIQLILASTVVCALVAVAISLMTPKTYQASVKIATTKVASSVSLGSAIETRSDENLTGGGGVDRKARLQSYVVLVKNPDIAQSVLDKLGDKIRPEDRRVAALLNLVEGELVAGSDTIEVRATSSDADLAALIANAWGEAYVQQVNQIYAEETTSFSLIAVQEKTAQAKLVFDQAQMELEALIAANQIDELTQKISQTQRTIDNLATIRLAAIDAETENIQERLSDTFEDSRNIDRFLKSALTMRDQVVNGGPGAAASNALALNLLKAQIFTTAGTDENLANVTLQTSLLSPTEQEMAADLDSLIGVLQRRQTDLEAEIRAISTQLLASESQEAQSAAGSQDNPLNPYGFNDVANFSIDGTSIDKKILELHEYIREFQGDIARYQGRLLDLSQARNLAWETYKNLVTKEAELGVVTGIQGKALSLASPATAPEGDTVNSLKNVLLSTAVGLTLGVLSAFALEFWWKYKGLDPVPVRIVKFRKTGG